MLWDPHCRVLVRLCLCFVLLCLDCGRPRYRVLVIMFELWVSSLPSSCAYVYDLAVLTPCTWARYTTLNIF